MSIKYDVRIYILNTTVLCYKIEMSNISKLIELDFFARNNKNFFENHRLVSARVSDVI